jgi:acyl-homoserine-lactone acylase
MIRIVLLLLISLTSVAQKFTTEEVARWKKQAQQVSIIRDNWGIAHVYGKTDADAVFGFLYAQCEDDFPRIELNYINAVARLAEVEGESKLFNDLRTRLFNDTLQAIDIYKTSDPWLHQLCDAFADGINYYLYTHPQVKPKLLTRFQSWMPFLFSEGSIGTDIESISIEKLRSFYGAKSITESGEPDPGRGDAAREPGGSNGFAIAPSRSASGNSLLLINPHTSFYFRPEIHMVSNEGLNAYGAVTWGQFFIYQGFNEHCGWMHTSSQADAMDEYAETIVKRSDSIFYQYRNELKSVRSKKIKIAFKNGDKKSFKEYVAYYTHHGPVIAMEGEKWITMKLMQEPLKALTQSFQRTKSKGIDDFKTNMDFRTNSSNNTVFADDKGNIAYWHGNFIPKRNSKFDWSRPVDGSDPSTEWDGLHSVEEMVHAYNPPNGWLQNCNSTPFTVAGKNSPDRKNYPLYMAPDAENPRGLNAVRVLEREKSFTLDRLIAAAYDPYLAGFEKLIPSLILAYDTKGNLSPEISSQLAAPISLLKDWDRTYGVKSIPTTLAVMLGIKLTSEVRSQLAKNAGQLEVINYAIQKTSDVTKLMALKTVVDELKNDFGSWQVEWGQVNRFQRLTGNIAEVYDDEKASIPIPYTSSFWGSLAAYGSKKYPATKKMYGNVGNSFVAVVEFGKTVKAKSLLAGGVNNNPASPHFTDQAKNYALGKFKDVTFYEKDVLKKAERKYHPGE